MGFISLQLELKAVETLIVVASCLCLCVCERTEEAQHTVHAACTAIVAWAAALDVLLPLWRRWHGCASPSARCLHSQLFIVLMDGAVPGGQLLVGTVYFCCFVEFRHH